MKKSELKEIIREEIQKVLSEGLVIGDTITPDMWNPSHPLVKKYKSVLTTAHKIERFMDKYQNSVDQMPEEGWIVLSGGSGMGTKFLKHLPIEALK
jgi:hypothetical protein